MITSELLDDILLEWSYRLKDGIPDVNDPEKVRVLNAVLAEYKLPTYYELLEGDAGATKTNQQEGLVCYFYDIMCSDTSFLTLYDAMLAEISSNPDKTYSLLVGDYDQLRESATTEKDKKIIDTYKDLFDIAKKVKPDDSRYGISFGDKPYLNIIENKESIHRQAQDWITQQYSCAKTIYSKVPSQFKGYGLIDRGSKYQGIRKRGIELLYETYKTSLEDDKWTPADVFIYASQGITSKALAAKSLLPGNDSLNSMFYGSNGDLKEGEIMGISLKMHDARAGKGTTFIQDITTKTITTDVPASDLIAEDKFVKDFIKFKELKRYATEYVLKDVTVEGKTFEKIKKVLNAFKGDSKKLGDIYKDIQSSKINKEQIQLYKQKLNTIRLELKPIINSKSDEYSKVLKKFEDAFIQSHTKFEKYLADNTVGAKVDTDENEDLKNIKARALEKVRGNEEEATYEYINILSKKTSAYDSAGKLIEAWKKANADVLGPFSKLKEYDNPFLALTCFCICQYGLNPTFYKCQASDKGGIGKWEEFPSKSTITNASGKELGIRIDDQPGYAGFKVSFKFKFNSSISYKTTIAFAFASGVFKIEVEELKQE